ncbi:PREDICTED: protein TIFY 10A [Nicotiana attenuata]|uniref:Protein TIFY n=1 Tax=Nicotiana attenuata TaxID=49451 RepID=I3WTA2_NICAT|nr:PREDICTED: protein TIFY 10A [Nicotiana attenuata]AFL46169.1 jasmonate ZIM domain protein d [Nicotiana attenuata]OIT01691.1 protein tify 10a [Nicotiana attenuata]
MGLSEIVDSGKVTGQKSQFSQTCNLLSQFLKKKGSFGDLNNLGIYRSFEPTGNQTTTTTMNLLPMIEKSGDSAEKKSQKPMNLFPQEVISTTKSEPEKAQMTIFYGGQVIVFDDFPAAKANEIMKLASKKNNNNNKQNLATNIFSYPMVNNQNSAESVTTNLTQELRSRTHVPISQSSVADLPIARRNSLTRFLEKRKDRITSTAPYQICNKNAASAKNEENKAWLGLGGKFVPVKTEQFF